jgi:hypothetical protein
MWSQRKRLSEIAQTTRIPSRSLVKETTFTGSDFDILLGFVSIYQRYKHQVCFPLGSSSDFAVSWFCHEGKRRLSYPISFWKLFNMCRSQNTLVAVPLFLDDMSCSSSTEDEFAHMNMLVFNSATNEIQRFDPNGVTYMYDADMLDTYLMADFTFYDSEIIYVPASNVCPLFGFQSFQDTFFPDPSGGLCGAWSLWFLEARLMNPHKDARTLESDAFRIVTTHANVGDFIRGYAESIMQLRGLVLDIVQQTYPEAQMEDLETYSSGNLLNEDMSQAIATVLQRLLRK